MKGKASHLSVSGIDVPTGGGEGGHDISNLVDHRRSGNMSNNKFEMRKLGAKFSGTAMVRSAGILPVLTYGARLRARSLLPASLLGAADVGLGRCPYFHDRLP